MSYEVYCLENFNWGEGYVWGKYETYDDALKSAKYIVDLCLTEGYRAGMTAKELYSGFMMFGDTPMIRGPENKDDFSGREYAMQRAIEICAAGSECREGVMS